MTRTHDAYYGEELDSAIKAMELIGEGADFGEAMKVIYEDNDSGTAQDMAVNIVFSFSRGGPDFFEAVCKKNGSFDKKLRLRIARKRLKNAEMELRETEAMKEDDEGEGNN